MRGSYRGPRPEKARPGGFAKVRPPDIDERIEVKEDEVRHMARLAGLYPNDRAYAYALARVRSELDEIIAIRDGKNRREVK